METVRLFWPVPPPVGYAQIGSPLQIPAAPMNCRSSFGWIDDGVRIGNLGLLISGLRPEGIRIGPATDGWPEGPRENRPHDG